MFFKDEYTHNPDGFVSLLNRSFSVYRRNLTNFYRTQLSLSDEQIEALETLNRQYYRGDKNLPIEAGPEVVAGLIFGIQGEESYREKAMGILGADKYQTTEEFRNTLSQELASDEPYLQQLFACCVKPTVY